MGKQGRSYFKEKWGLTGAGFDPKIVAHVNREYTMYHFYRMCYLLTVARFKYNNLPDNLNSNIIERTIIEHGNCLLADSGVFGYIAVPCQAHGIPDIEGFYPIRDVINPNGSKYHRTFSADDSVLMYNDVTHENFMPEIYYYANKFTELEIAKDTNIKLQKKPKAILTTKDNENSVRNMLNNVQSGLPYMLVDNDILQSLKDTAVLDLGVEPIMDKLEAEKNAQFSEFLTRLGYNNINIFKGQHLTVDESNANNENIMAFRNTALQERERAINKFNEMFGQNVTVEFNANALLEMQKELKLESGVEDYE